MVKSLMVGESFIILSFVVLKSPLDMIQTPLALLRSLVLITKG